MKQIVRKLKEHWILGCCLSLLIFGQRQTYADNQNRFSRINPARHAERTSNKTEDRANTHLTTLAKKALALGAVTVQGELKKWHKITLLIEGPTTSETNGSNPFLNYRLNVTFTNGSKKYVVPGYFAADGNAGNTGATAGSIWKVHFAPDQTGTWTYAISMRSGTNIAVSTDAGTAVSALDGKTGSFTVSASDKTGSDLRAKGRLNYVGAHYLQFAETGEYFVKGGVDSPENFLAYDDFDNTPDNGGKRKSWSPHVQDWRSGDPTWKSTKGKGIIGAINYLASEGLNAFSFLTMNIAGDEKNVFPYVSSSDYTRFDCSKLDQWEVVFNHADKLGLYLHFKLQERENCNLLDGGNLGVQRKVYFRELIARFGHHLALNWNVGEENIQTDQQRKDMAAYLNATDPYKHPIVLHTNIKEHDAVYTPLLGSKSEYVGVSNQSNWNYVYEETLKWVQNSANAGKKWIVANDEQNSMGVACDATYTGDRGTVADNQDDIRKKSLWGCLMASGAGVEYYFGNLTGETDLTAEDFRSRAKMWRYNRHALNFFKAHVPVTEVKPLASASRGWSLGKEGQLYVVYLPDGGSANLSLSSSGTYTVDWYDPRNGGALQKGSVRSLSGSGTKSLGNPPNSAGQDWVVLIKAEGETVASSSYRINVGGGNYTTSDGKAYSADNYASGGSTYTRVGDITNTTQDALYQTERNGAFSYNFPISNGTYTVVLHFAEIYATGVNQRKFNVDIEGQRKLTEYDIAAKAGGTWKAVQESFTVAVTDEMLTINFLNGSINKAKVCAIEILKGGTAVVTTPFRINSGGVSCITPDGKAFGADSYFSRGDTYTRAGDITNTTHDVLYQTERNGAFSYNFPISNGTYTVVLHFAEIYATGVNQRKFNVDIEGQRKLTEYDIAAKAGGAWKAVQESFTVAVTDGLLTVSFSNGSINTPKISAVEVLAPTTNTAPVLATIGAKTVNEGSVLNVPLSATDADGDAVTITATNLPAFASLSNNVLTFAPGSQAAGSYAITVQATDSRQATDQETFTLVVNDVPTAGPAVVNFTLMNADNEQAIKVLTSGEQLNLATLPTRNLNIRVNTNPTTVGSVKMVLSGQQKRTQTETGAPYALFGDSNGNYNNWTPTVGTYSLTATPYSGASGTGTAGTALTISFRVINQAGTAKIGVEADAEELPVVYYPNPFQNSFTLKVPTRREGPLPVRLYDGYGRLVYKLTDLSDHQQVIDPGQGLAAGLYVLQIGEGQSARRYKLMKIH
ncbi:putative secreted protein (Por secretion system target) [Larkinella arboricola]|uniref:Putative secreted protein (Por secretion system target) n=1 Tax=Larkinella arboricola TaxID=643671 RepID=A0A327X2W9_LARAB|nr:malectin domain-containing carbohydrate-binding protein [Larkinella arboricola]RAK00572.1 putative secreted protein (Por secretion system target) [Larkinella arboricola]